MPDVEPGGRAAGYVRVSQERSARNGYGLGAQEHEVRKFADYKGWDLVEVYREEGVSGYKKDRPALDRLLADAKTGRFMAVVFPSIDRAGRSVRDVIEIDQTLRAAGIATVFLREGVDTSTATGQLFRNIMASLAEFEGRVIYERLSKGKAKKRAEGGYVGGFVPYGYRRSAKGALAVVPEEVRVIQRIFRLASEGKTEATIATELQASQIPTRGGRPWRSSTIYGMLQNHFYTDLVKCDGTAVLNRHHFQRSK